MNKNLIRTILIAGALTSMAFGAMYAVRRVKEVMSTDEVDCDPRCNSGYSVPTPAERPSTDTGFIPVTIEIVDADEDE